MTPEPQRGRDATAEQVDPITFSVLLSRFDAIVEEMTLTLERSAWTSIIALAHDYSCALFDARGRQISMFDALPIHATSMGLLVQEIARCFGGDVNPGDLFLANDPYSRNTHIGDLVTAAPVFLDGEPAFWSVTKGHQLDTGAPVPSSVVPSARNVWQEGITIPPTRLVERGALREDVLRLYLANVRYADLLEGDLRAQIGSTEKGAQRLRELGDEHGREQLLVYVEEMIDYADRRMSRELAAIPDGVYRAEGWVDSDGGAVEHLPVRVCVTVSGDRVVVDYEGSAPQVDGGVNGSEATAQAAGAVPFLYYVAADVPHNDGATRHIEVRAPLGSICNAAYPASTSVATCIPSDLMQDVVNKAMAEAIPERVPAGGTRNANTPIVSGSDGRGWAFAMLNSAGGGGASHGCDGWPLYYNLAALGAMKILPVEQLELLYPVRVRQAEIEPESMGFGQWIGGPGVRLVAEPLEGEMIVVNCGDGCANPPHGALGGTAGIGGGQYSERPDGGPRTYVSSTASLRVARDERWVSVSTGGGGFGRPERRDPARVREDVRDGLLGAETAREVFGVVLGPAPGRELDAEATAARRAELAEREVATVDPAEPGAAPWLRRVMRPGDAYLLNPPL
ncbi:hydantoinase B/oxoprolinase family protein [Conexibacter sp. CPCC 206217]|uniref:hydantoinase B/oxoprolinase family protein n=1 Tax=Conexibacter sp. CPCC 206217 TaxID=3064574 RepID=UPI00271BB339|nr:hydantoinase B/oxoprolinase family protein [Conexibacter sp. CPCC 206217]MDO8209632.1 hydantoinase B/oxoprolinase family protein [Conexibacter sp. CPCC 206217]